MLATALAGSAADAVSFQLLKGPGSSPSRAEVWQAAAAKMDGVFYGRLKGLAE